MVDFDKQATSQMVVASDARLCGKQGGLNKLGFTWVPRELTDSPKSQDQSRSVTETSGTTERLISTSHNKHKYKQADMTRSGLQNEVIKLYRA
jgi:hypothetical protein